MAGRSRYELDRAMDYAEDQARNYGELYCVLWEREDGYVVFDKDGARDLLRAGASLMGYVKPAGKVVRLKQW